MLGCQDFCGYYDWSFHYVRRAYGRQALHDLWAEAIGDDSQSHYARAGATAGLRGLLQTWQKTGEDEHCDWTFTLDEGRNILRWDMRQCPSKGFLQQNDLHADEDYCDHCMGWLIPLLRRIGATVIAHEHNHCGQCWAEIGMDTRPHESLDPADDIRRNPLWNRGHIDRWASSAKLPLLAGVSASPDPCDVLEAWFAGTNRLLVLAPVDGESGRLPEESAPDALVITDDVYAGPHGSEFRPAAVLFHERPADLRAAAERFRTTPPGGRPLLMYAYLPGTEAPDFVSAGLPRPVPILPLLIRRGLYVHRPGQPHAGADALLVMLAGALGKRLEVAGHDDPPAAQGSPEQPPAK